tara:strand:- start:9898 stop:10995 length:1098 start_codon:yes stop_codon:yes gene_type:complete
MITKLIKLANYLDSIGLKLSADEVDYLIKSAAIFNEKRKTLEECLEGTGISKSEYESIYNEVEAASNEGDNSAQRALGIFGGQCSIVLSIIEWYKSKEKIKNEEDSILNGDAVLKRGSEFSIEFVTYIQNMLEDHGYILERHGADGDFGGETESSVYEFQRNNKLNENGEVNSETLSTMKSSSAIKKKSEISRDESQPETVTAGRDKLQSMSEKTKYRLYNLTYAEVGGQGALAQQAFMETVSNRAAYRGVSINQVVSNSRYYEPLMKVKDGDIDNLTKRCVNPDGTPAEKRCERTTKKYDAILSKVIGGSNITGGATHNASGSVARDWQKRFDGKSGSRTDIGGETFYSKTYEQKKLIKLKIRN